MGPVFSAGTCRAMSRIAIVMDTLLSFDSEIDVDTWIGPLYGAAAGEAAAPYALRPLRDLLDMEELVCCGDEAISVRGGQVDRFGPDLVVGGPLQLEHDLGTALGHHPVRA